MAPCSAPLLWAMRSVSSMLAMTTTAEEIDAATEASAPTVMRELNWFSRLEDRTLPQFNQVVVWTLLVTAAILAVWVFPIHEGERRGFVSLLSWLPDEIVKSRWTWAAFRGLLITGIALWALQRLLPWS